MHASCDFFVIAKIVANLILSNDYLIVRKNSSQTHMFDGLNELLGNSTIPNSCLWGRGKQVRVRRRVDPSTFHSACTFDIRITPKTTAASVDLAYMVVIFQTDTRNLPSAEINRYGSGGWGVARRIPTNQEMEFRPTPVPTVIRKAYEIPCRFRPSVQPLLAPCQTR